MRAQLTNLVGAAMIAFGTPTMAAASECPASLFADAPQGVTAFLEKMRATIAEGDPAQIYDLYLVASNRDLPVFRSISKQFVSDLLAGAFAALNGDKPRSAPFQTALTVLSNLPIWRSCDTETDVAQIAEAMKALAQRSDDARIDLDKEATAAIQRADGQLTPLLRKEHSSAADMDATIVSLEQILSTKAFDGTGYQHLVDVSLADKRQEAVFWHLGFDTPFARFWAELGETESCAPENLACVYLRDASQQTDRFLNGIKEAQSSPANADYYLYNDFVFLRVMDYVLADKLDRAEALIQSELIDAKRNDEANWFDANRPLDHIYVYKFLRDPDTEGNCVTVQLMDTPTNRCPIKEFYNPVQLGADLLDAVRHLSQPDAAERSTPQTFDTALRTFANHDYRVLLGVENGELDPSYAERFRGALNEDETAKWDCPAGAEPISEKGTPTICHATIETAPGNFQNFYFVGGDFTLSQAESVASQINERTKLDFRPYVVRPPLNG